MNNDSAPLHLSELLHIDPLSTAGPGRIGWWR